HFGADKINSDIIGPERSEIFILNNQDSASRNALETADRMIRSYIHESIDSVRAGNVVIKLKSVRRIRISAADIFNSLYPVNSDVSITYPRIETGDISITVDTEQSSYLFRYRVLRKIKAVKTAFSIRKGELIERQLLKVDIVETTDVNKYFTDISQLDGYSMKKDISVNTLISIGDVVKKSIVQYGDIVDILYNSGKINIRMKGRVLGNGYKGGTVLVENMETRTKFSARVVRENLLLIEPF
ncbi:MAG: flagellar basal body P-ring formation protein FlgA, partial [Actinomycetia bacterium]|nr:flagellar basal body P-ring formation protein FlgA [Actinomycetes bacterium]